MQIVVAWADKTKLVPTGRNVMRDRNWFPELRAEWEGKACMWARKGKESDLAKAKKYAESEGHQVYVFPPDERDPVGKARELAAKAAREG